MNQLQKALSEICNAYRLREKILIVPSFSQGHQITESLVTNGNSYINLRIKTLYEKGGMNLDNLTEKDMVNAEEDCQVCVRILARGVVGGSGEGTPNRGHRQNMS